jgi:hypothetical protein
MWKEGNEWMTDAPPNEPTIALMPIVYVNC